ncbi:hypothetical protein POPTR_006G196950v4 [Populus trichocarpa]|uniref:Uncharacterized protein n=1 Tax=Populus trichocarpa TaxID=3694 RepID=A0ACC0SVF4_POPTR|nr:hypothetical protein POPTR_006G196950v4 [Populus trichocarpa]
MLPLWIYPCHMLNRQTRRKGGSNRSLFAHFGLWSTFSHGTVGSCCGTTVPPISITSNLISSHPMLTRAKAGILRVATPQSWCLQLHWPSFDISCLC